MFKRLLFSFLVLIISSSFSLEKEDLFGVKVVCIDAGHGGKDGGCLGSDSKEKDVALAISLKLGKYIEENFKDVKVVYTRKTDVFLELWERADIANKAKADLFICVHANASVSKAAMGTETYVLGLHKSEENFKVAERENSVILKEDNYKDKYGDFDPNSPESYIALTMRQNSFLDQSLSFASKIQRQFTDRVGRKNRGVKQAGYVVLYQTIMPSVLIETGFLTNREEEKFLTSNIGQDYLASAIYRAFREYREEIGDKYNKIQDVKLENVEDVLKEKEPKATEVAHPPVAKGKDKRKTKNSKKNKEPLEPVVKGVVFKVQIATSSVKQELNPENFNGVSDVKIYQAGGLYRYTVGEERTMDGAKNLQSDLKEKGFKDAFIVAFSDGVRIPISKALNILR